LVRCIPIRLVCTIAALAYAPLVAGCGGSSKPRRTGPPARDQAPAAGRGTWVEVAGGGRTMTARGRPYSFWVRRGSPKRLLVFFEGGGGCFDYRSCRPGSGWFDDSIGTDDDPAFASGMLDLDDPENPVHGWTAVFVPSTTGDVHWGDARHTYRASDGRSVTIEHRGFVNGMAAARWAFANVRAPGTVLVTGCSAGSVGSAAFAPYVMRRYPRARVAQLGDSLAFAWPRPSDLSDWDVARHWPRWIPAVRRLDQARFRMSDYYAAIARAYPQATFAQINHASDRVQARFFTALGGRPQAFTTALRRSLRAIDRAAPNFRSVVLPGHDHCVLPTPAYNTTTVGGVRLRQWIADLVAGRPVRDLGGR
jgi:Pectinacetylesterase